MKIPFNLEEGIYFEDTDKMIFWGKNFEEIIKIDNPEIDENVIKWNNKTCFGGKKVNVIVNKDDFRNKTNKLEFVDFEEENGNPRETYKKFSEIFKLKLGKPNEIKDDGYGTPTELWNLENLQIIIGVGERFMEYEIFGIHKGEKFWELKP